MQYEESGEMLKYPLSVYTGQDEPLLKNLISWETNLNEILFSFISKDQNIQDFFS